MELKKYHYSLTSNSVWFNFDEGFVMAENIDDAYDKATTILKGKFDVVNEALKSTGFTVGCDLTNTIISCSKEC